MRRILPVFLFLLAVACKPGERYTDIKDEPFNPAFENVGLATPYHHGNLSDTPAPDGYKPFYISHYGRHGSRYFAFPIFKTKALLDYLEEAQSQGNLTEKGEQLLKEMNVQKEILGKNVGSLTARGGKEHRNIAARMFLRFPEVWSDGGKVSARASVSGGRCITSMCYSCSELQRRNPSLEFTFAANEGIYALFTPLNFGFHIRTAANVNINREIKDSVNASAVVGRLFRKLSPEYIEESGSICDKLVEAWTFGGCMDTTLVSIEDYMSSEEVAKCIACHDDWFFATHGNSARFGKERVACSSTSLKDVIQLSDEAIGGRSGHVADLRYAHDSGLLPLLVLMQVEPFSHPYEFNEMHLHMAISQYIPMAANMQLVFYRKAGSDDILVKLLLNEEETAFAGIEPVSGPYYRWTELKELWHNVMTE